MGGGHQKIFLWMFIAVPRESLSMLRSGPKFICDDIVEVVLLDMLAWSTNSAYVS